MCFRGWLYPALTNSTAPIITSGPCRWKSGPAIAMALASPAKCEEGIEVSLPPELLDGVVGYLDKLDLATCTILSRRWYSSARPKLFRTVFIHDHTQPSHVLPHPDSICKCGSAREYNLTAFDAFLHHSFDTDIARCINELSIKGGNPQVPMRCTVDSIGILLKKLPSLHSLCLTDIILLSAADIVMTSPVVPTRRLNTLSLNNIHVPPGDPPRDMRLVVLPVGSPIDLLRLFASVDVLHVTDIKFGGWIEGPQGFPAHILQFFADQASRIPAGFRFKEISFSHGQHEPSQTVFLYLLNTSASLSELRSLDIHDERPGTLRTLLKNIGPILRSLHIDLEGQPARVTKDVRLHCRLSRFLDAYRCPRTSTGFLSVLHLFSFASPCMRRASIITYWTRNHSFTYPTSSIACLRRFKT